MKMLGFERTFTFPFPVDIPSYTTAYLQSTPKLKRGLKFFKRYLYIVLKGQVSLEVHSISSKHKNILWINMSAPSLGDSLMDLSSRTLLKDRRIDLFTDKMNAHIYKEDDFFSSVMSDESMLADINYDLVIIDSYSTRSIRVKSKWQSKKEFVGMYGFYNGPEVNRVLFSFHRMNFLLGGLLSENEINSVAMPAITVSRVDKNIVGDSNLPERYIAIAIGGEWEYRTYSYWEQVIQMLLEDDAELNIVLIGSGNGVVEAKKLLARFPTDRLFNAVSKFTFNQTAQIIRQAQVLLCCDGGLMHAANAVDTPVVALFARLTAEMQLTKASSAHYLYDRESVRNIKPEDVFKQYSLGLDRVENKLRIQ